MSLIPRPFLIQYKTGGVSKGSKRMNERPDIMSQWKNWLDPRGPYNLKRNKKGLAKDAWRRVWFRKSKQEAIADMKYYRKLYPNKKFSIRKNKELQPRGEYSAFDIYYRELWDK